jgi:hypothetical protein
MSSVPVAVIPRVISPAVFVVPASASAIVAARAVPASLVVAVVAAIV